MKIELNSSDIDMIKDAFNYVRCLYWDNKLTTDESYCDGDCYECDKHFKIENWLESKQIK